MVIPFLRMRKLMHRDVMWQYGSSVHTLNHVTMLSHLSIPTMPTAEEQKYAKATDQQLKIKTVAEFNPIKVKMA